MNRLAKVCVMGATMAAAAAVSIPAFAGEAVIIPSEKGKAAPIPDSKATAREIFKLRDSAPGASPFDVLTIPMMPDRNKPLDPKEEKRRRLQHLEEKNWMMVGKGELQAEEENKNFLSVRDYSLDGLEK